MEHLQNKIQQRYPDIHFFLSFFSQQKKNLGSSKQIRKNFLEWKQEQNFDEIEIFYCIGLECGEVFLECQNWLAEKKQRALIFIENNLGSFSTFFTYPFAEAIIDHPQVHLCYSSEDPIESLAQRFPTDRLAIFVPPKKHFETQMLLRRSAAFSALYSDVLYSHILFKNVQANFFHLKNAFDVNRWKGKFANVPAIICGAGPSLQKSFSLLRELDTRALIIAGGSAIPILSQQGIRPHLALALDPNEEEYERFKQNAYFEGPFVFAPRLHHQVFATCNGPFGYLKTDTGGLAESWLEERLSLAQEAIGPDLGDEAFSVTTLAISMAYAFGCDPIILTGVDLAFSEGKHYAPGMENIQGVKNTVASLEKKVSCTDIFGKPVESLLKWVMEGDAISRFATNHPDRRFFNATEGGIGFKEIENVSLAEVAKHHCENSIDLEGYIHQQIQVFPCDLSEETLVNHYQNLQHSLERALQLCEEILVELDHKKEKALSSGKTILLQNDFIEEIAYSCFLKGIDVALQQLLFRYFPHPDPKSATLQREKAKWEELRRQIQYFLDVFINNEVSVNIC